ncbi:MAG: dockerin type I repeat-containing protein [Phycisphaerae bacterium]|nr:dockerin type I repeat-containing protein [Phycisphaerae bacterium]
MNRINAVRNRTLNALNARSRGLRLACGLVACALAASVTLASNATGPVQSSYTSTLVCTGLVQTAWTATNECCCDVCGGAQAHLLQAGVQFTSATLEPPTVSITDQHGQPIFINGALLTLVPSTTAAAKAKLQNGTISQAHVWLGYESNVPITVPSNATSAFVYKVTYSWSAPVADEGATWFSDNGDDLHGDTVIAAYSAAPVPAGTPILDGASTGEYSGELAVQNVQTQFGNSTIGNIAFANGSELDGGSGFVDPATGFFWLFLSGNLESNFNKLEIFIDYKDGGQNRLRGDNSDVDFNGLNRMGDNGSGNGLTFDPEFSADFYVTLTCGGDGFATYSNTAQILTNGGGLGGFIGSGGAGPNGVLYGTNGTAIALNNSNVAGVDGGTRGGNGAGVLTGIELHMPLFLLQGYTGGDVKVCAFINGGGHDSVSNQVLGGLGRGTGNLGEPRNVNFGGVPGQQYFVIPGAAAPCPADLNGDGAVDGADLGSLLGNWGGAGTGDINSDGTVNGADLALLLGAWGSCGS